MKKTLIFFLLLLCLTFNIVKTFAREHCINEHPIDHLNSKDLLNYIKENNLEDKIMKVCSSSFCHTISISSLETDIKTFINQNIRYLKSKEYDSGLEAELKGFKIEKIVINSCL